ncbi:bifunctional 2-C-methyl-D-erythritol 4-phosphate cytidylyltransferase/2-C-methyl-D-erythritol 2,4-cyclodiphosphate synthase [Bosea sp. (in: a-proteobacteria)]|uniref:bifunctional 2-C-methyl-D-erythritol 4-phosphate cytidylyltransferase/2-C-methyl-D-erythritol 2,4-cyclodiphosphate synthase n=1 Tax=Bosea sp. (in: a-proteobacteria) TaxID=1871050 RepID=UPI00262B87EE|nr:bifunctional 2-C-methyl-D-erythritol 4-phosphate cytidylyltransferase/2-C-methyl-D-erythritol 2,4-cyclodiphosphate synthase [Bosea sp. (in: a-proteobacteria)]MCO5093031.1 bifunctional 2-C-methyl-D-erythritol 4-phosphate cytidylyltransferase/2-C-methyl-D-erythritol 2,4-cyclodiphosphate synthase [Bosea sp. (in: a-proteobacteria)]
MLRQSDALPPVAALLVAAGKGLRAGGNEPKQYRLVEGRPVLTHALTPFLAEPAIARVAIVIGEGDEARYANAVAGLDGARLAAPTLGGPTRQASVRRGLLALSREGFDGIVLVHDAARPFVTGAQIGAAIGRLGAGGIAAIPALPMTDTVKRTGADGHVVETPPRSELVTVQTPQAFRFRPLLEAHEAAEAAQLNGFTDDAALMEWAGHPVATFPGDPANVKLTHAEDFLQLAARSAEALVTRVGTGYDVHAFGPGDHLWLGGVRIGHDRGVIAHSDGDVALHALTDALLGALAEGDIGTHFPPSDPQWRGAASARFLAFAAARVGERGGRIDFLDLTVVCEAPKIGPHREAIRAEIAAIAGIPSSKVAIKATTSERMGFTGRGEGLAALATATIRLPEED